MCACVSEPQVRKERPLQPQIGGCYLGRGGISLAGDRGQEALVTKRQHLHKGGTAEPSMACLDSRYFS